MVNINNAHAGLSSASVLAKFSMEGFTSCARLSPHSYSFFLSQSFSFPPRARSSVLSLWKAPYGSDAYSDRTMWPISSNWRSCGGWVSLGGGGVIDPMDGGGGQTGWQRCIPHSSWQLNEGQAAEHRMSFIRTIVKRAGHPRAPRTHNHPVKS